MKTSDLRFPLPQGTVQLTSMNAIDGRQFEYTGAYQLDIVPENVPPGVAVRYEREVSRSGTLLLSAVLRPSVHAGVVYKKPYEVADDEAETSFTALRPQAIGRLALRPVISDAVALSPTFLDIEVVDAMQEHDVLANGDVRAPLSSGVKDIAAAAMFYVGLSRFDSSLTFGPTAHASHETRVMLSPFGYPVEDRLISARAKQLSVGWVRTIAEEHLRAQNALPTLRDSAETFTPQTRRGRLMGLVEALNHAH